LSNFIEELLKEIKRNQHLSLTEIGKVIGMSRQHIDRERDKPGSYPEVVERLKKEFKKETTTVKKAFPKIYTEYPVPDQNLQGSDLPYITKDNKDSIQQEIRTLQSDFVNLLKTQELILAQQKALIAYTAKKDANGNAEVEKEILEELTPAATSSPGKKKTSGRSKKNSN
jgi:hypothetical protein